MMSREDYRKYFEVLELDPEASMTEVRNAYARLKRLYSTDSIAITPLAAELPEKKRKKILKEIEDAHVIIMALLEKESQKAAQAKKAAAAGQDEEAKVERAIFSGPLLKQIREQLGIGLHEISLSTKIRQEILTDIEQERFDDLPPEIYLAAHLKNYASCIMLNPKKVADDYLKRYREWKNRG